MLVEEGIMGQNIQQIRTQRGGILLKQGLTLLVCDAEFIGPIRYRLCQISGGKSVEFNYVGSQDLNTNSVVEIKLRV